MSNALFLMCVVQVRFYQVLSIVCSFVSIFCVSVCSSIYLVCCCTKCTNYIIIIGLHATADATDRAVAGHVSLLGIVN